VPIGSIRQFLLTKNSSFQSSLPPSVAAFFRLFEPGKNVNTYTVYVLSVLFLASHLCTQLGADSQPAFAPGRWAFCWPPNRAGPGDPPLRRRTEVHQSFTSNTFLLLSRCQKVSVRTDKREKSLVLLPINQQKHL
jgi:hypothetical protein